MPLQILGTRIHRIINKTTIPIKPAIEEKIMIEPSIQRLETNVVINEVIKEIVIENPINEDLKIQLEESKADLADVTEFLDSVKNNHDTLICILNEKDSTIALLQAEIDKVKERVVLKEDIEKSISSIQDEIKSVKTDRANTANLLEEQKKAVKQAESEKMAQELKSKLTVSIKSMPSNSKKSQPKQTTSHTKKKFIQI